MLGFDIYRRWVGHEPNNRLSEPRYLNTTYDCIDKLEQYT